MSHGKKFFEGVIYRYLTDFSSCDKMNFINKGWIKRSKAISRLDRIFEECQGIIQNGNSSKSW
jgi:hypothetical protein